jgi:hypothetical protein
MRDSAQVRPAPFFCESAPPWPAPEASMKISAIDTFQVAGD